MNRILSTAGKALGGLFLLSGGTIATGILVSIVVSHATGGFLILLSLLLIFFGLTPAVIGGWLLHTSSKAEQRALRSRFFQLLQASRGRLCLLEFASATQLEPTLARRYLDEWAKEFSANFEVTEEGEIYYLFSNIPPALPESKLSQLFKQVIQRLEKIEI